MSNRLRSVNFLAPVWRYRNFIYGSIRRDFESKYANSMLGVLWSIIQPLAMILIYTLIFSKIMQARLPGTESGFAYSIYLCAGILTWGLFAEIVSRSQNIFFEHAKLLKKISFPRFCLPVITILNALINFAIIFGLFLIFLIVSGNFPGVEIVYAIPVLLVELLFAIGLGMTVGVLNVFFRDVGQFFTLFLQFWFWLTPIVYTKDILPPEMYEKIATWNPMTPIINSFQDIFVYSKMPNWHELAIPFLIGLVLCALGLKLFRSQSYEIIDEL